MALIACNIKIGIFKQHLCIVDNGNKEDFFIPIDEIPNFIAKQKNINDVFIKGVNQTFLKQIESETKKIEINLYNKETNKIFHYV